MSDCLRDLEWVKIQLGQHGKGDSSVRAFLSKHHVPIIKGHILESQLYSIWQKAAFELVKDDPVERAVRVLG